MAEGNPLESVAARYGGATVNPSAGQAAGGQMSGQPSAPASVNPSEQQAPATTAVQQRTSENSDALSDVANRYGGYRVEDAETAFRNNVADAGRQALQAQQRIPPAERDEEGRGIIDWLGDVGRGTLLGPITDPIAALILTQTHKDQNVTYRQAMNAIEESREARGGSSASANLVGAFLGGGVITQGLRKAGTFAATKSGLVDGAMRWMGQDKVLNRIVGASAAGGSAGAIEEGIRVSLEETVDATQGEGFDTERVTDSILMGTLIGGAASPVLQEGMNGARWMGTFLKRQLGNSDAQTYQAQSLVIRAMSEPGDTPDEAVGRFRQRVLDFQLKNGRMPAAAEIMKPEQVSGIAEVIRSFSGLDRTARELGEKGVQRALDDYDRVVRNGMELPSPNYIRNEVEILFDDLVKREGDRLVEVDPTTMAQLMQNRDYIRQLSANPGAERMSRVLDGQADIRDLEKAYENALNTKSNSEAFNYVADLRVKLRELIEREQGSGGARLSERGKLENLVKMEDALAKQMQAGTNLDGANFKVERIRDNLDAVNRTLQDYRENGLQITLSDANAMRRVASRTAFKLRDSAPLEEPAARRVRDLIAPIGTKEVPQYGETVQIFNLENLRADAQATGELAARGEIDAMDLMTTLRSGRLPGNPKAGNEAQRRAIRLGAAEGTMRNIQNEQQKSVSQRIRGASRMAQERGTQRTVAQTLGNASQKEMTRSAQQVMDTYESMKALTRPGSTSELAEERQFAADVLTGAAFGNLGGAGRAALLNRLLTRSKIPAGSAKKIVEMLGDPDSTEQALEFMQSKGIRVGPMFSAVLNHLNTPVENDE